MPCKSERFGRDAKTSTDTLVMSRQGKGGRMQLKFRAWNKITDKMITDSPISMGSIIRDNVRNQTNFNQERR